MRYHSTPSKIDTQDNLVTALKLAKAGLPVFPARASNKRPHVKDWPNVATTDADQLARWWRKWPDAMPALPTGERSGVAVLDVDMKDGKDGMATLRSLGFDPDTMSPAMIATPSGGQHIYFRHSDGLGSNAGQIGPGVDVRANGGFVVAPGAINGKGAYGLIGGPLKRALADLPPWPTKLAPLPRVARTSSGEKTGLPFEEIRDALMAIPNDDSSQEAGSRDWWLHMGMALHHETGGGEEGLNAFHEWSAIHDKYDSEETDAAWQSFGGEGRTGATILSEARYHGWRNDARIDRLLDGLFTDEELAHFDLDPDNPLSKIDAMLLADDETMAELARGYDLTEDGVIRAFSDRHEGELLFDHTAGAWFRFCSHRWERENTLLAKHYARDVSTELAKRDPKAKHLKKVNVWEAVERGARTVRAFAVSAEVWDRDPFLLGTPGGVVDLKTGKLRKGRPHDRISKATAAAPIPLGSFDPKQHCPRWIKFLQEALGGDTEAIRFLQQWFGYCLTGDTSEHALVFVYGPGGSGKSTAINVMADLLGDYSINVATSTLTKAKHDAHPEELARMDGARLAFASETEKGKAWAENRIKSLTGGDKITARHMRQNSFEFVPQMKLVIVGNNQPSLSDVDSAIQRRFNILPFDHPPKTKDAKLVDKLRTELPGILSWAIQGALDWQAHGLVRPQLVDTATSAYFAEQDTFGRWLEEKCETSTSYTDTSEALWDSWRAYAYANGEDPGSKLRVFPESMEQRGFKRAEKVGANRQRGFKGIRLIDVFGDDDEII